MGLRQLSVASSRGQSIPIQDQVSCTNEEINLPSLISAEVFRIDQQTQGGAAHVIRTSEETLTWIDGMTEAMLFDTEAYEQDTSGRYAMFDPSEFNNEALFTDGTCRAEPAVEDEIFELPADMSSAPAQP